eukprot:g16142.t1
MIATIAILAIAAVSIFSTLSFALRYQSEGIWQVKVSRLADSYMEQILARRFDETTPPGGVPPCVTCSAPGSFDDGETRAQFDDVDDFDGVDDLPPVDENGAALAGFDNYRVQVSVAYPDAAQQADLGLTSATDAKLITLTITPPGENPQTFTAIKANF